MTEPADLPLFAAADGRAHARVGRRRRRTLIGIAGPAMLALLATLGTAPRPRLLWNASASSPIGLYWILPPTRLRRGDTVVAWPPARARTLAAQRRYLPTNVPLVKRVAGLPGDRICGTDLALIINARRVASRLSHDATGRALPDWRGCRTLAAGQLLLLTDAPASFDGRYFGPTERGDVIGKATLLWRR